MCVVSACPSVSQHEHVGIREMTSQKGQPKIKEKNFTKFGLLDQELASPDLQFQAQNYF